jgi:hypothetical protein
MFLSSFPFPFGANSRMQSLIRTQALVVAPAQARNLAKDDIEKYDIEQYDIEQFIFYEIQTFLQRLSPDIK